MSNEEQVTKFATCFFGMAENMRKMGVYNDDLSRKVCVLHNLSCCQAKNGRRLTITDISKISGMALSNVSRFLRPLEEKGYVEREREGRTIYLNLTAEGEKLYNEKVAALRGVLSEMLSALTDDEAAAFLSGTEKMSEALNNIIERKQQEV